MIEIRELSKIYGNIRAVDNISFRVEKGEVLGFLGPNGAGKSTTMKIVTCYIPPTSGTVEVGGKDIFTDPVGVREQIGYLPESAPSYPEMTVTEFLSFIAEVRGYTGAERTRRIDQITELTSLRDVQIQIIDTLSKGYRQRVCFAQALIHDPPVLILDEPTDGLDPNQKHEMREVIRRMSKEKTIILSTHILEEMEAVCGRAIIISRGRIVADGTPRQLAAMSKYHNAVTLKLRSAAKPALMKDLEKLKGVAEVAPLAGKKDAPTAFQIFAQKGKVILQEVTSFLEKKKISVEEVYLEHGRVDEVFREVTGG
ncbi:MAG: ATP-binding cassette domain-containing protein [SAR324 cluster bacterium]|nr:ATP-binding cassette domain-containing protein [SAR324 cluster bacterium]MCZ6646948.1 ATP-binding cassette domain-containing protein [SAR324 cluster bacterium]